MTTKHHYSQPAPSNMQPQRGGAPRNTGSPPPDVPPESYSRPPQTQSAKPGNGVTAPPHQWTPQPNVRPGERGHVRKRS